MKFYTVICQRPWIPRYAAWIYNEYGQMIHEQKFYTKRARDRWVREYKPDQVKMLFKSIVG